MVSSRKRIRNQQNVISVNIDDAARTRIQGLQRIWGMGSRSQVIRVAIAHLWADTKAGLTTLETPNDGIDKHY